MRSFASLLGATLLLVPLLAKAETCEERAPHLAREAARAERHSDIWRYSWMAIFTGAIGVNATLGVTSDEERQEVNRAVTVTQILIPLGLTIFNSPPITRTRAPVEYADECARADALAALIEKEAAHERSARRWFRHVPPIAGSLVAATILSQAYDDNETDPFINAAISIAGAEAWIWSRPQTARHIVITPAQTAKGGAAIQLSGSF